MFLVNELNLSSEKGFKHFNASRFHNTWFCLLAKFFCFMWFFVCFVLFCFFVHYKIEDRVEGFFFPLVNKKFLSSEIYAFLSLQASQR